MRNRAHIDHFFRPKINNKTFRSGSNLSFALMRYPYTIGQRFIAAMLVSSLLLQSCYNPSIPNLPQPREVFRVKEVLSLEEIREEEKGLSANPTTLPLKYESPTITHDLPRDKLVVTQSTLQVGAVAENPSKKLVPVVDSSRQLNKPTQDSNFSKPGNYEELKDNFYKGIASLNQVDKVRAEQLLKQIYSEEEINVPIKIKNFIREHSNHFQSLLILFDTSGEDWEFKDDHINTFVNMIKEQKEGVKSQGNNNVKKDVNHLPSVTGLAADPARVKLGENILLLIGAELDERLIIYHRLQEELKEILKEDGYLRGLWSHLWRDLEEPELLVNKKTYERLVQQPQSASWLKNLEEQVFANYKKVYQELETFKKELAEKYPTHPEWVNGLDKVAEFYKHFEQNLCSSLSDPVQFL